MIKIICVGKIKENYLKEAIQEYEKRIQKYTKINLIEVPDESNGNILEKEKEHILKYIKEKDYIITLEIDGKNISSLEFSNKMNQIFLNYSTITFIIGGSLGLSKEIKEKSHYQLSFSKMTFPHQLFRVMLLEQIYRSYKIINHETYHK